MSEMLNNKISNYLKIIVECYIETGLPVSSKFVIENCGLNVSSATVRNAMSELEKNEYLVKAHVSSGRIPTVKGMEYYAHNLSNDNNLDFKDKIEDIFAKRKLSINQIIDKSLEMIAENYHLTLVSSSDNSKELLKTIELYPINETQGTILIVSSYGNVWHTVVDSNVGDIEDIRIAIRLFKERLINTPLCELALRSHQLAPIFGKAVKNADEILKKMTLKLFKFQVKNHNTVYNKSNIILDNSIPREKLNEIINIIENKSIWKIIEADADEDQNMLIKISNDSSFISRKIGVDSDNLAVNEIAVVGTNRMDFQKSKAILNFLANLIQKHIKGNDGK